ncbi:MAG: hypothetical protein NTV05_00175, partial [Acidobacteria bacterium]|nr:hypothetical protein [Acidobacteriota bacterium]
MSRLRALPAEQFCHFRDRLGERSTRTVAAGDTVEVLLLCRDLSTMRAAIRERVARLATLRLARFVPVRSAAEAPDDPFGFEIVSDYIPGTRLSDILQAAGDGRAVVPTDAALHVVRQLLGALAALHQTRAVTHGLIAPERLIVTPRGHLVVADCALGLALERLSYSRAKLWNEFRIPVVPGSDVPRLDQQADIAQTGLVAVALLAGRPLEANEYPERLLSLIESLMMTDGGDARVPISKALNAWLRTALQVETRTRFSAVCDAQMAFEEALSKRRRPASGENPIKSLVDASDRARMDGHDETGSTTDCVGPRSDAEIPPRELLPLTTGEGCETKNPGTVAPDPLPRITPPPESLLPQWAAEPVRADEPVNQPWVTPVLREPQPEEVSRLRDEEIVIQLREAAIRWSVVTAQRAERTSLERSRTPAWVLRAIGRTGGTVGRATLGGLTRAARGTVRAAQETVRTALVIGAAALHGPVWALRAIGRTGSTVGRATLGGLTRAARGTVRAAQETVRTALVIGAVALHGPVWALRAIGRTGRTFDEATLGGLTRAARGTVRAAQETVRTALVIGAAALHGPVWALRA